METMTTETLERHMFSTPHSRPVQFWVRPGTSDWNTCNAITSIGDEYHLPEGLSGWALDVGAHIGACTVALLLDNPGVRVVAIEALPENVELLRKNLELNGVADRCIVIEGAASFSEGPVRIGYGDDGTETGRIHDYIGNMDAPAGNREVIAPGVMLVEALVSVAEEGVPYPEFVWAKLDCEGCEAPFLRSSMVGLIRHIEGEVHPQAGGADGLRAILEATHDVTFPGYDANPMFGPFVAVRR